MRKVILTLTLAISFFAAAGMAEIDQPGGSPECAPNCPWVR